MSVGTKVPTTPPAEHVTRVDCTKTLVGFSDNPGAIRGLFPAKPDLATRLAHTTDMTIGPLSADVT